MVSRPVCEMVPWEMCQKVQKRECRQVPYHVCRPNPDAVVCLPVHIRTCHDGPQQTCRTIPGPSCYQRDVRECKDEVVKVGKRLCTQVAWKFSQFLLFSPFTVYHFEYS